MKTTIDIPDDMLKELIDNTAAHTKREAILTAISEFNRKRKVAQLANVVGTLDEFMTGDELAGLRDAR